MVAPTPRRYWDAFCFIAILNNEQPHGPACERILNDASEGRLEIIVSPLTIVEVVRPKGSPTPLPRETEEKIRDFFENDYVKLRVTDRLIAEAARELCWNHALHPRDAIHLATALDTGCECIETTDPRLLRLNSQIGNPPILIRVPFWEVGPLFDRAPGA